MRKVGKVCARPHKYGKYNQMVTNPKTFIKDAIYRCILGLTTGSGMYIHSVFSVWPFGNISTLKVTFAILLHAPEADAGIN